MIRTAFISAFGALFFFGATLTASVAAEHLSVSGDSVRFYGDRYLLEADGNVRVVLNHAYVITGNTFSMDLRLNRFVVAGDVDINGPGLTALHGAGFADFFDDARSYFVPVLDQPDRWTYLNNDFAHPAKGREMPGDPFFLPDVSSARVTVRATSVDLQPLSYMHFHSAHVLSAGIMLPLPSYVLNFSSNPDFRQNSLAGAIGDASYDFGGSDHTLSTVHFRYDQTNKTYASFEQHYVSPGGYAVASINPATRPIKQYNLIGLGRITPKDQIYGFYQEITYQNNFEEPLQASAFASIQLTHALRQSFLQLAVNQSYNSLLAQPSTLYEAGNYFYYGDPSHAWVPNHPVNVMLTWQGNEHRIGRLPLNFRMRSSAGFAHDGYFERYTPGEITFDNVSYPYLYFHSFDGQISTRQIKLGQNAFFNASYERNRQWFSIPHYNETAQTIATISRPYGARLSTYIGYNNTNVGDFYGPKQLQYYPSYVFTSPIDGKVYEGYSAFHGFATYRSLFGSVVFTPNPDFALSLLVKHNQDFPAPIPGVVGNPPWQAIGDLRVRVSRHTMLDIARTYNFGYPGQVFSPNFQIQVLP